MCNMRSSIGILLVAFGLLAMAKAEDNVQALRAVTEGTNQFSSSFFQTVTEENPGNLITSPLSAAICLAMAAYGARGETERQFKNVLHMPSPDSLGTSGYQALIDSLNNVTENKLAVANKVFTAEKFAVKPTYKELTETYFRSATQLVDFAQNTQAAEIINTWVKQNTANLIDGIVTPADLDAMTALVLVNAVYFKGIWKYKFKPEDTKDMPFHVTKDTVKQVPTMSRTGKYVYGNAPELNAQFIVLPYVGDELKMVIVLPNEIDGLAEVEKKMQNASLSSILQQGYERQVELYLPKFKIESKIDLNDVLGKMGIVDAFTSKANFSGIAEDSLAISKVLQKAFIEVNEEGSEAAAVTVIQFQRISAVSIASPIPVLKLDRQFIFSIVKSSQNQEDNSADSTVIFTGCVKEPNY